MPRLQIPVLETRRLRLESLTPSHSAGMFELWCEPAVCRHSGSAVDSAGESIDLPAGSRDDSDRLLEFWTDRARAGTGFRWAVIERSSNDFAGAIGFNSLGASSELAFHFVPRCWGRGLAAESSRAALAWVFSRGTEVVQCNIEGANTESVRLAERLGFELTKSPEVGPGCYELNRDGHEA